MSPPKGKSHRTAVVLIPPEALWGPIQEIRVRHDERLERWMPHVTLLYPFLPEEELGACVAGVERACRGMAPFELELGEPKHFAQRRGRNQVWLAPTPREPIIALHERLVAEFPSHDDTAHHERGFNPHLSIGQAYETPALDALLAEIRAVVPPIRFLVEAVFVIARPEKGPFRVWSRVPLVAGAKGARGQSYPP